MVTWTFKHTLSTRTHKYAKRKACQALIFTDSQIYKFVFNCKKQQYNKNEGDFLELNAIFDQKGKRYEWKRISAN